MKKRWILTLALIALGAAVMPSTGRADPTFQATRYTSTGALDTTFDTDGRVDTDFSSSTQELITAVAPYPGDKVVAAGCATVAGVKQWAMARYLSSTTAGSLDPAFGGSYNGKFLINMGGSGCPSAIAVQPDGKIVVAGQVDGKFALARLTAAGTMDATFGPSGTFGNSGKVITDLSASWEEINAMDLQSDGKIVVAGHADGQFAVARYTAAGALDTTFGAAQAFQPRCPLTPPLCAVVRTGWISTALSDPAQVNAVSTQSDGKIVVAGQANGFLALARYTTVGALDTTFGPSHSGKIITLVGGSTASEFLAVSTKYWGLITAAGRSTVTDSFGIETDWFTWVRYDANGALLSMKTEALSPDCTLGKINAASITPDGKTVVTWYGRMIFGGKYSDDGGILARYTSSGSHDSTFGTTPWAPGTVTTCSTPASRPTQ